MNITYTKDREYTRRCNRCDNLFKTPCKFGKVCVFCRKENTGEYMMKIIGENKTMVKVK